MSRIVFDLPLDLVEDSPWQPRGHYDEARIEELADQIERDGLNDPPHVRFVEQGTPLAADDFIFNLARDGNRKLVLQAIEQRGLRVELVFGHRRTRAMRVLRERETDQLVSSWETGPFVLRAVETDDHMRRLAFQENEQSEPITPIDEALFFERTKRETGKTWEVIAADVGVSASKVKNAVGLLKLPPEWKARVASGEIPVGKARALMPVLQLPEALRERVLDQSEAKRALKNLDDTPARELREALQISVYYASNGLGEVSWPMDRVFTKKEYADAIESRRYNTTPDVAIVQHRTCNGCPLRATVAASHTGNDRCFGRDCHSARSRAWAKIRAQGYAADHAYELADYADLAYGSVQRFYPYNPHEKVGLAVALGDRKKTAPSNPFDGDPEELAKTGQCGKHYPRCSHLVLDVSTQSAAGPRVEGERVHASFACSRRTKGGKSACLCQRRADKQREQAEETNRDPFIRQFVYVRAQMIELLLAVPVWVSKMKIGTWGVQRITTGDDAMPEEDLTHAMWAEQAARVMWPENSHTFRMVAEYLPLYGLDGLIECADPYTTPKGRAWLRTCIVEGETLPFELEVDIRDAILNESVEADADGPVVSAETEGVETSSAD